MNIPTTTYVWKSKKSDKYFYTGITSRFIEKRLKEPIRDNPHFKSREDIELLFERIFLDKEQALSCEAGFIHYFKVLTKHNLIYCLNKNNNKYNSYITKPAEFTLGLNLCNKIMGQFSYLKRKINIKLKNQLKIDIGLR